MVKVSDIKIGFKINNHHFTEQTLIATIPEAYLDSHHQRLF